MNIRWSRSFGTASMIAAALGLGACGDVLGPEVRYDPAETLQRLNEVLDPLGGDGDFLLALDLAVATLDYYGASVLADAITVRRARGPGTRSSLRGTVVERIRGSAAAPTVATSGATAAFTLPTDLTGQALEWDGASGYVPGNAAGAPANGVRFVLYRMSSASGYPLTPLVRIGYLDITDEDGATAEGLRVRAMRTDGPNRLVADYYVTLAGEGGYEAGWLEVTTRGAVGGNGTVGVDLTETLEWSLAQDRDELTLSYRYDRSTRSVELAGVALGPFEAMEWDEFDFNLWLRARSTTRIRAEIDADGSLDGEIREDGYRVVRIDGYDGQPLFRKDDRGRLSTSEERALAEVWTGITDLIWFTDWVVTPADLLMLEG